VRLAGNRGRYARPEDGAILADPDPRASDGVHIGKYTCNRPRHSMKTRVPQRPPPYSLDRDVLEREVEVDVFRASGPGGQHVNKTESALRLTHPPSGVVVIAQDSPSQYRNRETAFKRLVERLARLNHVPKKRVPTRPSRAAKKRRIEEKKLVGRTKRSRGRVASDE
jgi:protein subunit release factor B